MTMTPKVRELWEAIVQAGAIVERNLWDNSNQAATCHVPLRWGGGGVPTYSAEQGLLEPSTKTYTARTFRKLSDGTLLADRLARIDVPDGYEVDPRHGGAWHPVAVDGPSVLWRRILRRASSASPRSERS